MLKFKQLVQAAPADLTAIISDLQKHQDRGADAKIVKALAKLFLQTNADQGASIAQSLLERLPEGTDGHIEAAVAVALYGSGQDKDDKQFLALFVQLLLAGRKCGRILSFLKSVDHGMYGDSHALFSEELINILNNVQVCPELSLPKQKTVQKYLDTLEKAKSSIEEAVQGPLTTIRALLPIDPEQVQSSVRQIVSYINSLNVAQLPELESVAFPYIPPRNLASVVQAQVSILTDIIVLPPREGLQEAVAEALAFRPALLKMFLGLRLGFLGNDSSNQLLLSSESVGLFFSAPWQRPVQSKTILVNYAAYAFDLHRVNVTTCRVLQEKTPLSFVLLFQSLCILGEAQQYSIAAMLAGLQPEFLDRNKAVALVLERQQTDTAFTGAGVIQRQLQRFPFNPTRPVSGADVLRFYMIVARYISPETRFFDPDTTTAIERTLQITNTEQQLMAGPIAVVGIPAKHAAAASAALKARQTGQISQTEYLALVQFLALALEEIQLATLFRITGGASRFEMRGLPADSYLACVERSVLGGWWPDVMHSLEENRETIFSEAGFYGNAALLLEQPVQLPEKVFVLDAERPTGFQALLSSSRAVQTKEQVALDLCQLLSSGFRNDPECVQEVANTIAGVLQNGLAVSVSTLFEALVWFQDDVFRVTSQARDASGKLQELLCFLVRENRITDLFNVLRGQPRLYQSDAALIAPQISVLLSAIAREFQFDRIAFTSQKNQILAARVLNASHAATEDPLAQDALELARSFQEECCPPAIWAVLAAHLKENMERPEIEAWVAKACAPVSLEALRELADAAAALEALVAQSALDSWPKAAFPAYAILGQRDALVAFLALLADRLWLPNSFAEMRAFVQRHGSNALKWFGVHESASFQRAHKILGLALQAQLISQNQVAEILLKGDPDSKEFLWLRCTLYNCVHCLQTKTGGNGELVLCLLIVLEAVVCVLRSVGVQEGKLPEDLRHMVQLLRATVALEEDWLFQLALILLQKRRLLEVIVIPQQLNFFSSYIEAVQDALERNGLPSNIENSVDYIATARIRSAIWLLLQGAAEASLPVGAAVIEHPGLPTLTKTIEQFFDVTIAPREDIIEYRIRYLTEPPAFFDSVRRKLVEVSEVGLLTGGDVEYLGLALQALEEFNYTTKEPYFQCVLPVVAENSLKLQQCIDTASQFSTCDERLAAFNRLMFVKGLLDDFILQVSNSKAKLMRHFDPGSFLLGDGLFGLQGMLRRGIKKSLSAQKLSDTEVYFVDLEAQASAAAPVPMEEEPAFVPQIRPLLNMLTQNHFETIRPALKPVGVEQTLLMQLAVYMNPQAPPMEESQEGYPVNLAQSAPQRTFGVIGKLERDEDQEYCVQTAPTEVRKIERVQSLVVKHQPSFFKNQRGFCNTFLSSDNVSRELDDSFINISRQCLFSASQSQHCAIQPEQVMSTLQAEVLQAIERFAGRSKPIPMGQQKSFAILREISDFLRSRLPGRAVLTRTSTIQPFQVPLIELNATETLWQQQDAGRLDVIYAAMHTHTYSQDAIAGIRGHGRTTALRAFLIEFRDLMFSCPGLRILLWRSQFVWSDALLIQDGYSLQEVEEMKRKPNAGETSMLYGVLDRSVQNMPRVPLPRGDKPLSAAQKTFAEALWPPAPICETHSALGLRLCQTVRFLIVHVQTCSLCAQQLNSCILCGAKIGVTSLNALFAHCVADKGIRKCLACQNK